MKRPVLSFLATIILTTLGIVWDITWVIIPILVLVGIVLIVKKRELTGLILMNLFFLLLTAFHAGNILSHTTILDDYHATDVSVTVQAIGYPEYTDGRTKALFQVIAVDDDENYDQKDKILISVYDEEEFTIIPGGIYHVTGRLKVPDVATNPGGFDYHLYLNTKNIHLTMWTTKEDIEYRSTEHLAFYYDILLRARSFCVDAIHNYLNGDEGDVLASMMFGTDEMDTEILDDFRQIGVAHLLAVSGLHVGIVYLFFSFIMNVIKAPKQFRFVFMSLILIGYIIITGMSVSVIRASLMLWFVLLARVLEKKADSFQYVCLAGLIILLLNPLSILSVSFQLSFTAVLSIVLFFPVTEHRIKIKNKILKKIVLYAVLTLIVQISVAPILAVYFHTITLISLIANLMIVPIMSVVLVGGLLALVVFVIPLIGSLVFDLMRWLLAFAILTADRLSQLPFASIEVRSPKWYWLILYYLILMIVFGYIDWKKKYTKICFSAALSTALIFYTLTWFPPLSSRVSFIDVGMGDCIFVETRTGETVLIDGGGYLSNETAKYDILPYMEYYDIRSIDIVVATHSDSDHCKGLVDLIGNIPIGMIYANDDGGVLYDELLQNAHTHEIPLMTLYKDDIIELSGGSIVVFNPTQDPELSQNNNAIAVMLDIDGYQVLLTSDLEYAGIKQILEYDLSDTDILKIPHHGSYAGNLDDLMEACDPRFGVISVGTNGYRLPNKKTLDLLDEYDTILYRTDTSGCVTFIFRENEIKAVPYLR